MLDNQSGLWYNIPIFYKGDYTMPTKSIGLRIDEDLLKYLEQRAEHEHRTLSNMIISILLDAKEQDEVK